MIDLQSFPTGGMAVVLGASGGIGSALEAALRQSGAFETVLGLSRSADGFDLGDEASIAQIGRASCRERVFRAV